ncbi:protein translocase subunit SecF [Mycetocola reblochoni]|uniref:Protein-export membrane protein SecF n=2 Tax=Mycetocola reblochoni TaxID=331618 RepID=A0A1R4J3D3_9MICO|nr:protein translocase subunit SecF [Mycetocola reblochoni]RLP69494.1 protein translocase subunit SecF [Mycetocola reblochoni]SJN26557.1 Protein-export membrane protein SecF (TC 3.A.5.1.1) [Mycetocola reblochoni REB411]
MVSNLTSFGNDLYTGKRSINFVGNRKIWFSVAIVLVVISVLIPVARGGFNFSIEFTGGSQFTVSGASSSETTIATTAVDDVVSNANARVTTVGDGGIRVQTDQLTADETLQVSRALASAYDVDESEITNSFIGASWGQDITRQALLGLVVFLALAFLTMALYFRTWKMSAAAMIALLDVLVITLGVYAASDFEVSPATVIGFLTILGYSLYDTVVVFDKIRENTTEDSGERSSRTFSESVNLAVNQTLVRSINTSVVAALPVAAILVSGIFMPGVETLRDIALSLLVGILVATYSTIFVAAPLYALFREKEPTIAERDARVLAAREKALGEN